ncbi:uncharacterized protein METZ01_LOCUS379153, partial [marine metagenome]
VQKASVSIIFEERGKWGAFSIWFYLNRWIQASFI